MRFRQESTLCHPDRTAATFKEYWTQLRRNLTYRASSPPSGPTITSSCWPNRRRGWGSSSSSCRHSSSKGRTRASWWSKGGSCGGFGCGWVTAGDDNAFRDSPTRSRADEDCLRVCMTNEGTKSRTIHSVPTWYSTIFDTSLTDLGGIENDSENFFTNGKFGSGRKHARVSGSSSSLVRRIPSGPRLAQD